VQHREERLSFHDANVSAVVRRFQEAASSDDDALRPSQRQLPRAARVSIQGRIRALSCRRDPALLWQMISRATRELRCAQLLAMPVGVSIPVCRTSVPWRETLPGEDGNALAQSLAFLIRKTEVHAALDPREAGSI
jgi:hypothetical protein